MKGHNGRAMTRFSNASPSKNSSPKLDPKLKNKKPETSSPNLWISKKYLPTKESLGQTKTFRFLGNTISNQELWHFSRHSLSYGILTGSVCAFLPIPLQMLPCIIICAWIRCNIPVALVIVWISNPLTMPGHHVLLLPVGRAAPRYCPPV